MRVFSKSFSILGVFLLLGAVGYAQSLRPGVGALPYADASGTGFSFRVWAPNASSVQVLGSFNQWQFGTHLLAESNGYWSLDVDGAVAGQQYKFYLNNQLWRKDPRSRRVTQSENSVLVDPATYAWQDAGFVRPAINDMVIYELHPGSFYDPTPNDNEVATFHDITNRLDYLVDLGVNVIELMPISRFPGDRSWGYNPIDLFAIENGYGTPDEFRQFVDECHQRGLSVHLDIVHNHYDANNSNNDLWEFDGWTGGQNQGGIYFYQPDGTCCTIWGRRPHFGRQGVRDFITDNVRMWLDEYHIDGFRWDSPINIKFYDGDHFNPEGYAYLQEVNQLIATNYSDRFSVGEDQHMDAGFSAEWFDSFHYNIVEQLLPTNDVDRNMWAAAGQISTPDPMKRVIYTETHDKVGVLNGSERLVTKIDPVDPTGTIAQKRAFLGAALTFTSPGIPLLFMGQEWAEFEPFDDFDPLDWDRADEHLRSRLLFKHLIHMRRNLYGTTAGLKGDGHDVFHVNDGAKVIAFHRWDQHGTNDDVVVVANFSGLNWGDYHIEFPYAGTWNVIFNSDHSLYNTNFTNYGSTQVVVAADGATASVQFAPYSVLIFSRSSQAPFDADQDAMLDSWELLHGLSPTNAADAVLDPDADQLTNLREFELQTDPHEFSALHIYDTMHVAGTENNWSLTTLPMKNRTHYEWDWIRHVTNLPATQFKFVGDQDWAKSWGDADQSSTALPVSEIGDPGGAETPIALDAIVSDVTLRYVFNETNQHYQIEALAAVDADMDGMNDLWEEFYGLDPTTNADAGLDFDMDGFTNLEEFDQGSNPELETPKNSDYDSMHLTGSLNSWSLRRNPMKLVDHFSWEVIQPIWNQPNAMFKFAGNEDWAFTWGDDDQFDTNLPINEFGDWQGGNFQINDPLNGVYRFFFNQKTVGCEVEFVPFVDHDGDGLHDVWESFFGYSTNSVLNLHLDTDEDGLDTLEEYQAGTSPLQEDPSRTAFSSIVAAGSFNDWSPTAFSLTLIDHYQWQGATLITNPGLASFKFAANGNWSTNWGGSGASTNLPLNGIAVPIGANIDLHIPLTGEYLFSFNEQSLQFQVVYRPRSSYTSMGLAGSFNGWDPSATSMTLIQDHLWEFEGFFTYTSNLYFKFVANRSWSTNWGDNTQTGTTLPLNEQGGSFEANIHVSDVLNGTYRFQFNDTNGAYGVELIDPADHDSDGIPDFWENLYGLDSEDDSDAHLNFDADAMSNFEEYIADTNPTNTSSLLQLMTLRPQTDAMIIEWKGGQQAVQYLQKRVPGIPDWETVYTNAPPTLEAVTITNTSPESSAWFRIMAERP